MFLICDLPSDVICEFDLRYLNMSLTDKLTRLSNDEMSLEKCKGKFRFMEAQCMPRWEGSVLRLAFFLN